MAKVTLYVQGKTIVLRHLAPGENILQAALERGIELPSSCCTGKCYSCTAKLQSGKISDDSYLLTAEQKKQGYILLCCSAVEGQQATIITHQEDVMLD